ncbi:MAG: hypothetical protein PHH31_09695, partial [Acidaminococcaceae bacterium]|nr:hypothetical protein [Acidaminococcaceae bacterium]
ILLKDNHVDFAGGIEQAIRGAQSYLHEHERPLKIEIEVRSKDFGSLLSVLAVVELMMVELV